MRTACFSFFGAVAASKWGRRGIPVALSFFLGGHLLIGQDQLQTLKTVAYKDALTSAAQPVLDSCGSWPPQFVNKKDADNPKAKIAKPDASADLLLALAGSAGLDIGASAREYDGFFLRLFDGVNTFNPGTANTNPVRISFRSGYRGCSQQPLGYVALHGEVRLSLSAQRFRGRER